MGQVLTDWRIEYRDYEYYLSATLLICAMFGMGLTLRPRDFLNLLRAPAGVVLVLTIQVLLSPLLALGLSWLFQLPTGVALGLLLVAAMPGGLFSNILTHFGQGNVALSVAATGLSTTGCLLTTSLVLGIYARGHLPADFQMPVERIVFEITVCLLLPLCLGMVFRNFAPQSHGRISDICIRLSVLLLILLILGASTSGRIAWFAYGVRTPVALFLFGFISIWLSYGLGYLARLPLDDSYTVGIETVVRNGHLGVLLKAALFPADGAASELGGGVLYVVLVYSVMSLVIGISETTSKRFRFGLLYAPNSLVQRRLRQDARERRSAVRRSRRDE